VNVIPPSLFFSPCLQYSFSSLEIQVIFLPMFSACMWQSFLFPVEQEPTWLPQARVRFVYPVSSFLDKVNSPEICSASPESTCVSSLGISTSCMNLRQSTGYFFSHKHSFGDTAHFILTVKPFPIFSRTFSSLHILKNAT